MSNFNLKTSPIRQNINGLENGQLSIFENEEFAGINAKTILDDVENMLDVTESHSDDVVRIAVMGEVSAGKSTFVNTIVGKKVAYTDLFEATEMISEITYADNEYAKLISKNGETINNYSFDDMISWVEEMVEEEQDFSSYEKFSIGVSSENMKNLIFVDTPGLLSITPKNHSMTNKYVAETDYIIWVVNSRNLGAKKVNECIEKTKLSGKPMIGIINKVDTEAEKQEIEKYVKDEYSSVFEEIFFVSSKNAWELMQSGVEDWLEKTGFEDLLDCIEDLAADKEHSTSQTQYYQFQRDKEVHIKMREKVNERKKHYDNEIANFSFVNSELKKSIEKEMNDFWKNNFFVNERIALKNANDEEFISLVDMYNSSEYIEGLIIDKYNELTAFIQNRWNVVSNALSCSSSQINIDFSYDKTVLLEDESTQKNYQEENNSELNKEKIKRGLTRGTAVGVAFAGYTAWLGPAAAALTFGEMFLPFVIPCAIAGLAASGFTSKMKAKGRLSSENAQKKQKYADELYYEIIKEVSKIKNKLLEDLFLTSDHYYQEKIEEYKTKTEALNFDFTSPAFEIFAKELDTYIEKLEIEINSFSDQYIPAPPELTEITNEGINNELYNSK